MLESVTDSCITCCFKIPFCFIFGGGCVVRRVACGILVPRPGIEPGATEMKALNPNHWTARELPRYHLKKKENHDLKNMK